MNFAVQWLHLKSVKLARVKKYDIQFITLMVRGPDCDEKSQYNPLMCSYSMF